MLQYVVIPTSYDSPIIAVNYCLGKRSFISREIAELHLKNDKTLTPYLKSKMMIVPLPPEQGNRFSRTNHPHQLYPTGMIVTVMRSYDRNVNLKDAIRRNPAVSMVIGMIERTSRERDSILSADGSPMIDHGHSRYKIHAYLPGAGYVLSNTELIYPTAYLAPDSNQFLV